MIAHVPCKILGLSVTLLLKVHLGKFLCNIYCSVLVLCMCVHAWCINMCSEAYVCMCTELREVCKGSYSA